MRQLKDAGQFQGEMVYQNKNGEKRRGELRIVSIISENDKFLGTVAVCTDISEHKKIKGALNQSNKTINTIINSTEDAIYAVDKNWNFIYCNEEFAKLVGQTPGPN